MSSVALGIRVRYPGFVEYVIWMTISILIVMIEAVQVRLQHTGETVVIERELRERKELSELNRLVSEALLDQVSLGRVPGMVLDQGLHEMLTKPFEVRELILFPLKLGGHTNVLVDIVWGTDESMVPINDTGDLWRVLLALACHHDIPIFQVNVDETIGCL